MTPTRVLVDLVEVSNAKVEIFSNAIRIVITLMKKRPVKVKTVKNCADEIPEGSSMTFAAALCNAGRKS